MKNILIENIKNIGQLSFDIPNPGLHILTGTNGSGKTTLFTCISRICNNNAYRLGFSTSDSETLDIFSGSITYSNENGSVKYWKRSNNRFIEQRGTFRSLCKKRSGAYRRFSC